MKKRVVDSYELSSEDAEILRKQTIDENGPGTILKDFQTFLDFIQARNEELTQRYRLLPLKSLPILNAQMTHPLKINLERPQSKSFPHLQALFLLSRATGLAMIKRQNNKYVLAVDEEILKSWSSLNPTERYFTLLEAWLLRGNFEILGEREIQGQFSKCADLLKRIQQEGLKISGDQREEKGLQYWIGMYNVAFLELFGLLQIEHGRPVKGKGWKILKLYNVPLGKALFNLLLTIYSPYATILLGRSSEDDMKLSFGEWQKIFQPFFPEWHNNLVIPEIPFRDGLHIFKVSLAPTLWRRIAIPSTQDLHTFSYAILDSFKFDSDHLYSFIYEDRFGQKLKINHPFMEDEPPLATEFLIGNLPLPIGADMIFHFDFGDDWEFGVTLENIEPKNPKSKVPKILEKHGKAPEQYPRWHE